MHPEAYAAMDEMLNRINGDDLAVLDVGSADVNGTLRPLVVRRGWRYTGVDIAPGRNVDVVSDDPYYYPFPESHFDVVMSGGTMEHVEVIWLWIFELVRVLKPGGLVALCTHWQWPVHRHPVDCWRILDDGMRALFDATGQLEDYRIEMAENGDTYASAFKVTT